MTPELLSVAAVAQITGLSEGTIRAAISEGELPAAKIRRRIRVSADDLAAWIDDNRVKPPLADIVVGRFTPPAPPRSPLPDGDPRAIVRARRRAA